MRFLKLLSTVLLLTSVGANASVWNESPFETKAEKQARRDAAEKARLDSIAAKEKLEIKRTDDGSSPGNMEGTFTDPRDNKTYTVKWINGNLWMTQNMNIRKVPSVCFENNDRTCLKTGRLYTWDMAKRACPEGWRLPTVAELSNVIYDEDIFPHKGGYRAFNGDFYAYDYTATFWTAESDPDYADYAFFYTYESPSGWKKKGFYKDQANSVRCIKGEAPNKAKFFRSPSKASSFDNL